jgi:outer membrane immunogenic protein
MRMISRSIVAAVVGFASCIAAEAADVPFKAAPMPMVTPSWSGWNFGVGVGSRSTINELDTLAASLGGVPVYLPGPGFYNGTGARGALFLGYDWQVSNWLVGIEADVGLADSSVRQTFLAPGTLGGGGDFSRMRTTWDASIRGRIGYVFTPILLGYFTGGGSWLNLEATGFCSGTAAVPPSVGASYCGTVVPLPSQTVQFNHRLTGYTLGGGFDFAVTNNFLLRAEYRFAHYDAVEDTSRVQLFPGPAGLAVGRATTNIETHTTLFGAYYKFR